MQEFKKVALSSFDNSWYNPGAGFLKRTLWYFVNVLFFLNPLNPISNLKILLLRLFGAKVGKGVVIKPSVNIKYPWQLVIGNNVWIGEEVWIDNLTRIQLSDNTTISQGAMLLTGSHNYKRTSFDLKVGEINLEEGAWVGARAVVCPGVRMASHSILTAGSIATKSTEPYTIYQGNPALPKRLRQILK